MNTNLLEKSKPKQYDKCTSCGKEFIDHMGIIGTCKELQEVKAENKRLKAVNNRLWHKLDSIHKIHYSDSDQKHKNEMIDYEIESVYSEEAGE